MNILDYFKQVHKKDAGFRTNHLKEYHEDRLIQNLARVVFNFSLGDKNVSRNVLNFL